MPSPAEEMVTSPEALAACCEYLRSYPQIGFDTEFVGEDTYHPTLCLIQVATPDRLILIDPQTVGPLDAFWDLIVDPGRVVVVHAGREETRLCRQATGQTPGNLFDVQIAAGLVGLTYPLSHGALVNQLLRVQLTKGETLTEWRHRPLTPSQVTYAYDDVRYLLSLYQQIDTRLQKLDRREWAREEFAWLAQAAAPEDPVGERWRKSARARLTRPTPPGRGSCLVRLARRCGRALESPGTDDPPRRPHRRNRPTQPDG